MPLPHTLPRYVDKQTTHFGAWGLRAPPGHTLEHVMDPEYWVHALQMNAIQQYDTIRVVAEDGSYGVDLMFIDVDERRMWARTAVVQKLPLGDKSASQEALVQHKDRDGWVVEWGGPVHKWRVLSPAGALASKGHSNKQEAEAALAGMKPKQAA
jgi:hypothetical protein